MIRSPEVLMRIILRVVFILLLVHQIADCKDYAGAEYRTKEAYTYGRFETRYKPAAGDGTLASLFTYHEISSSREWNEIDFEIMGRYDDDVQVSSIGPGQITRNSHQWVNFNTHDDFHNYAFEWTPDYIAWFIDGIEVYRQTGAHILQFIYDQKIMMNIWNPEWEPWSGHFDDRILPIFAYYDWVSYASYTPGAGNMGTDNNFTLQWQDDFNEWDQNRWEKATHTWGGNGCDFYTENAVIKNGHLILCLTKLSPLGYMDTTPPSVLWTRAIGNKITVIFSEKVEKTSAENTRNYIISGINVLGAKQMQDGRYVELTVDSLISDKEYSMVVLGIKDDFTQRNRLLGQSVNFQVARPLSFPIKINVGGKAYQDYLPDQIWSPNLEYGHMDGYVESWPNDLEIENTEEDSIYINGLHELVVYRVRVPNGHYKVTLMLCENDVLVIQKPRIYNIVVEGQRVAENLNLYEEFGLHRAYDIVSDVQVNDEMLDIHFTNLNNFSLLNGLIIEQISDDVESTIGSVPEYFKLSPNYPNPFNPSTRMHYSVAMPAHVIIELYNALGQKITTLVDDQKNNGNYELIIDGTNLTSGLYMIRMAAGSFHQNRKLMILK